MGGGPTVLTFSRAEFLELQDHAYWTGFDYGVDTARRDLRDEIRDELADELTSFDPECALCVARREVAGLQGEIRTLRSTIAEAEQKIRGTAIRRGPR